MHHALHETMPVQRNTAGRILLVEDDDVLCYALERILAAAGYEVARAQDYRVALRILEDGDPVALLLTDLLLPGVNGFALARMGRLRHRDLKVVYITGAANVPEPEARGPILQKPVDHETLLRTVREALSGA